MRQFHFSLSPSIQIDLHSQMGKGTLWKVYPDYNKDLQHWELTLVST